MHCLKCETGRRGMGNVTGQGARWAGYYECSHCDGFGFGRGLREFIESYLACALWTGQNWDKQDSNGNPDDMDEYSIYDFEPESLARMQSDCKAFYEANQSLWSDAVGYDDGRAGHDFWLTRNGHGAGFWDREEIRETREQLTKASKAYKSIDLYIDENNKVRSDK